MSENKKKAAPKADQATENNDDLLGDAQAPEAKAPEAKAPEAKAPEAKAPAKKAAAKKGKSADEKKIEAAQGDADNDYLPEEKERHLFHVKMEKKVFSPSTGKKLTKDFVQIYNSKEWGAYQKNGGGLGYTCTVLWNPENYK